MKEFDSLAQAGNKTGMSSLRRLSEGKNSFWGGEQLYIRGPVGQDEIYNNSYDHKYQFACLLLWFIIVFALNVFIVI